MVIVSILPAPFFKGSLAAVAEDRRAARNSTPSEGPQGPFDRSL
jgi:hypothetical protein